MPKEAPIRRQEVADEPRGANRPQPGQDQQPERGGEFPQQIIAAADGLGGINDDGVAGQVARDELRQGHPEDKDAQWHQEDAKEIEQYVLSGAHGDFGMILKPGGEHADKALEFRVQIADPLYDDAVLHQELAHEEEQRDHGQSGAPAEDGQVSYPLVLQGRRQAVPGNGPAPAPQPEMDAVPMLVAGIMQRHVKSPGPGRRFPPARWGWE